jgi:transcriptional regulator with XRE-family HTH domain
MGDAEVYRDVGRLLRHHRTRLRVTQQQLADRTRVSVRTIRSIEAGCRQQPRRETVRLVADGLGLTGRDRAEFEAAAGHTATTDELRHIYRSDPIGAPAPTDALVGRRAEIAVLAGSLAARSQRLMTVTGLAGVGKTRLALEVAGVLHGSDRIAVLWASAGSSYPTLSGAQPGHRQLATAIRTGLDGLLATSDGRPGRLGALVTAHPTLVVLDGYGTNDVRADRIMELLRDCGGVRVLLTSEAPHGLSGEQVFPLAPLALPEHRYEQGPAGLAMVASVRLLTRHIRQVRPEFVLTASNSRAVAALCHCADGIPGALEAVASWFAVYEPGVLRDYVEADPFDFLATLPAGNGGTGLRERLRRTIDALDPAERSLLGRLAGLDEAWSVADAVAMTGLRPARCARLVRRLLVQGVVRTDGGPGRRFRVLNLVRYLQRSVDGAAPASFATGDHSEDVA